MEDKMYEARCKAVGAADVDSNTGTTVCSRPVKRKRGECVNDYSSLTTVASFTAESGRAPTAVDEEFVEFDVDRSSPSVDHNTTLPRTTLCDGRKSEISTAGYVKQARNSYRCHYITNENARLKPELATCNLPDPSNCSLVMANMRNCVSDNAFVSPEKPDCKKHLTFKCSDEIKNPEAIHPSSRKLVGSISTAGVKICQDYKTDTHKFCDGDISTLPVNMISNDTAITGHSKASEDVSNFRVGSVNWEVNKDGLQRALCDIKTSISGNKLNLHLNKLVQLPKRRLCDKKAIAEDLAALMSTPMKGEHPHYDYVSGKTCLPTEADSRHRQKKTTQSTRKASVQQPVALSNCPMTLLGLNQSDVDTDATRKSSIAENDVWQHRRLEQQACMLWSSEQKRRYQQQHANKSSEWVDNLMRKHWESLSDRDKHRYFQRARQATYLDRSQRHTPQLQPSIDESFWQERLEKLTVEQLRSLFEMTNSAKLQRDIIQHILCSLQRRLFMTDCRRLTYDLYCQMMASLQQDDAELSDSIDSISWKEKIEERARRRLYKTLEHIELVADDIVAKRLHALGQQTSIQYQNLVDDVINGFSDELTARGVLDDCFQSEQLGQLLDDLQDLGCHRCKLNGSESVTAVWGLQKQLSSTGLMCGSTALSVGGRQVIVQNISCLQYQKELLNETCSKPEIVHLVSEDIDSILNLDRPEAPRNTLDLSTTADTLLLETASHVYRLLHGVEMCCSLDTPSCILSNLLILCRLHRLQQQQQQQLLVDDCGIGAHTAANDVHGMTPLQSWSQPVTYGTAATMEPAVTLDGILCADSWLTSPIESGAVRRPSDQQQLDGIRLTESAVTSEEMMDEEDKWLIHDDFNYVIIPQSDHCHHELSVSGGIVP